ncbi:MAG: hypothetical protein WHV28_07175 [Bacteroidota bacterium]
MSGAGWEGVFDRGDTRDGQWAGFGGGVFLESVRNKIREAIKQGAECILLYDKKGANQDDIEHGILKFIQRSTKTFKKVSIIKNGIIKTQKYEDTKWE